MVAAYFMDEISENYIILSLKFLHTSEWFINHHVQLMVMHSLVVFQWKIAGF